MQATRTFLGPQTRGLSGTPQAAAESSSYPSVLSSMHMCTRVCVCLRACKDKAPAPLVLRLRGRQSYRPDVHVGHHSFACVAQEAAPKPLRCVRSPSSPTSPPCWWRWPASGHLCGLCARCRARCSPGAAGAAYVYRRPHRMARARLVASAGPHCGPLHRLWGQMFRGGRVADTPCRPSGMLWPRAVAALLAGSPCAPACQPASVSAQRRRAGGRSLAERPLCGRVVLHRSCCLDAVAGTSVIESCCTGQV